LFETHGKYDKTNSRTNYFLGGKNEMNEVLLIIILIIIIK